MTIAEKLTRAKTDYDEVYEAGQQREYDIFWDTYQQNGKRTGYTYAFCGAGWVKETFRPKYDMVPTGGISGMFYSCDVEGDLVEVLENLGVTLDLSKATASANSCFANTEFTRLGVIDVSKVPASGLGQLFSGSSKLHTIDKLIVNENQTYTNAFTGTSALENITVGGVIGKDLDMKACPLSVASMKSIISCLKNYAGTSNAGTYKLSFSDACWMALETEDLTMPAGGTWRDYVQSLGWLT